jgi:hypothetical protein
MWDIKGFFDKAEKIIGIQYGILADLFEPIGPKCTDVEISAE